MFRNKKVERGQCAKGSLSELIVVKAHKIVDRKIVHFSWIYGEEKLVSLKFVKEIIFL